MTLDPIAIATIGYVCNSAIAPITRATHGYVCVTVARDILSGDGGTGVQRREAELLVVLVPAMVAFLEKVD